MPLNTWWVGDTRQRYWMEITERRDLGGPLLAPKLGRLTWGYDLVSQVQPGDRVLHWSTLDAAPRLVGWSEITEHATVIPEYTWTPRHGQERTTAGWRAELGGLHPFDPPVTSAQLRPLLEDIVAVNQALKASHKEPIYFPLTRYGRERPVADQGLRATEAYFVKFPAELFDVLPGISAARIDDPSDLVDVSLPEDHQPPGTPAPAGRTTRAQDPQLRAAIERRALDVARDYYERELGGVNYEEVGKPYDVQVTVDGHPRRCEVKGSSLDIDAVELTTNEVEHARTFTPVDLIVVDRITPTRDPHSGEVTGARGGRRRIWPAWTPAIDHLRPTKFAYTLPSQA